MPYLNLDPNYFEHPKTRRLVGLLGPMSDVLPLRLWAYCAKIHPRDGAMKGYSESELSAVLKVDFKKLSTSESHLSPIKALIKVGFLKKISTGFSCVDWRQHEGHLEAFSRRGKTAAKARWSKYALSIAKGELSNAPAVPSVPTTPSNQTGGRTGDGFAENGQRLPDHQPKALIAETAILMKSWHFKGQYQGVRINDLPADYCQWAIKNLVKLTAEERLGLEIVIKRKAEECAK